ncbi:tyrosine recombinase XerC [Ferrimonas sediminicola]|uniref:Tyrosine recombinase XerC n=1 Tax=Ferrimonas sediminicola TaxID=2569538 RepID=A0A4U1BLU4_9GAMM|nr:tyrosine recombinase XerC [Ferrimonas sediminicola]TKB51078.1 tyrosine recombinase XerC [Ferrimonas sediminicola]
MVDTLARFERYLRSERQYSPHTCRNYLRELERCAPLLREQGMDRWQRVTLEQLQALLAKLHRRGLSPRSLALTLSALRQLGEFLVLCGEMEQNPAKHLSAPKQGKPLPKNLDVDQMDQLLSLEGQDPLVIRDRTMMELLYSSGLRLAELVSLDLADLDLNERQVRVTGKGGKTRLLPVTTTAVACLKLWLCCRPQPLDPDDGALFLSSRGKRISHRSVQARMAKWGMEQSVGARVHPHKLRHAFATHMLESSGDLRAVQELLGHANLSTTQVYTHLDFQHLAEVYDQAHPRAKKS